MVLPVTLNTIMTNSPQTRISVPTPKRLPKPSKQAKLDGSARLSGDMKDFKLIMSAAWFARSFPPRCPRPQGGAHPKSRPCKYGFLDLRRFWDTRPCRLGCWPEDSCTHGLIIANINESLSHLFCMGVGPTRAGVSWGAVATQRREVVDGLGLYDLATQDPDRMRHRSSCLGVT